MLRNACAAMGMIVLMATCGTARAQDGDWMNGLRPLDRATGAAKAPPRIAPRAPPPKAATADPQPVAKPVIRRQAAPIQAAPARADAARGPGAADVEMAEAAFTRAEEADRKSVV